MIELNEQQEQALDATKGAPVQLIDRRTKTPYVLLRADVYEQLQALLAEDEFDIREAYPLMDAVAAKEGWLDPEMDEDDSVEGKTP
jgi:hypothetical protein